MSLHTLAIIAHAFSATLAFFTGFVIIFSNNHRLKLQLTKIFIALLAFMEIFLLFAIFSHLSDLLQISQLIFGGLAILGLYMLFRAYQALVALQQGQPDNLAVVDHIGFNLISLFDGFAIVSAIDLQAPGWLVGLVAVGAVVIGIYSLNLRKKGLLRNL